jgi:hypothetical protein
MLGRFPFFSGNLRRGILVNSSTEQPQKALFCRKFFLHKYTISV